jgi:hypothetical protein
MHAGKDIENREEESSAVKGKLPRVLALHASLSGTKRDYVDSADDVEFISEMRPPPMGKRDFGALAGKMPDPDLLPLGYLVGLMLINPEPVRISSSRWFFGPVGIEIRRFVLLPMVPWKGSLGRFDVPGMSLPEPHKWEWLRVYEALVLEAAR